MAPLIEILLLDDPLHSLGDLILRRVVDVVALRHALHAENLRARIQQSLRARPQYLLVRHQHHHLFEVAVAVIPVVETVAAGTFLV